MNEWQQHFTQKLETMRSTSRDRFERIANDTLTPVFDEFSKFTSQHHVRATAPLSNPGIRTYKFALTENVYVLMVFRHGDFRQCEAQVEFSVPGCEKSPNVSETAGFPEFDADWCRRMFEQALDRMLDAVTDSLRGLMEASPASVPT